MISACELSCSEEAPASAGLIRIQAPFLCLDGAQPLLSARHLVQVMEFETQGRTLSRIREGLLMAFSESPMLLREC